MWHLYIAAICLLSNVNLYSEVARKQIILLLLLLLLLLFESNEAPLLKEVFLGMLMYILCSRHNNMASTAI